YPFTPLADAVGVGGDVAGLCKVLAHFREHATQARAIFGGSARRPVLRVLASMIEERLRTRAKRHGIASPTSIRIASLALADAELAAIGAWLGGEIACEIGVLADTLHRIAQASAAEIAGTKT
ncbi:MAG TPA: hypothetical protein VJ696_06010, partial [Rhodanobacteraceae bacterium]|nr:hypothetical protein [Rhodanobacteraceae bacterium]